MPSATYIGHKHSFMMIGQLMQTPASVRSILPHPAQHRASHNICPHPDRADMLTGGDGHLHSRIGGWVGCWFHRRRRTLVRHVATSGGIAQGSCGCRCLGSVPVLLLKYQNEADVSELSSLFEI